ncbi:MAG: hypothetical protein K8W52_44990 [Deltaproteobacteria bacterium]|nr:hypothetical protein [Deltaproteobacteria bacterium]
MKRTAITLSVLTITACYGAAPPHPAAIQLPELSDEATIDVHSNTTTTIENRMKEAWTCPAGHVQPDPACTVTRYEEAEPVTRTETVATYGAQPITYGQFRVMTDPDYDAKVARLDDMRQKCRRANVPRWVGMGLALGGVVAIVASGNTKPIGLIGWGGLAGGGLSYAFGYYGYGGRTCNEARALYHELDVSEEAGWKSVWGADYATEMKTLSEQFNARGGRHAPGDSLGMR